MFYVKVINGRTRVETLYSADHTKYDPNHATLKVYRDHKELVTLDVLSGDLIFVMASGGQTMSSYPKKGR